MTIRSNRHPLSLFQVYVWHTKTQMNPFPSFSNIKSINSTNLLTLYKNILTTKL